MIADTESSELLDEAAGAEEQSLRQLTAAAVTGQAPAGPELRQRPPVTLRERGGVRVSGALLATDGGFTLHAATLAAGHDRAGREALVRYALRPPLAQERLTQAKDDLVRLTLKRPFSDGTFALELDPLSLLCRLVTTIPPPRFHTVRYSGVLASASKLRSRIVPQPAVGETEEGGIAAGEVQAAAGSGKGAKRCGWRPWAELMKRVFNRQTDCSRHRAGDRSSPGYASVPSATREGNRGGSRSEAVGRASGVLSVSTRSPRLDPCCLDEPGTGGSLRGRGGRAGSISGHGSD